MNAKLARHQARLNPRLPLILLTDEDRRADWAAAAHALPRKSIVIVRARDAKSRAALAGDLENAVVAKNLRLLIAGDAELAAQAGAAGLHLPQAQMLQAAHWRVRHPDWIITASVHTLAALVRAQALNLDALLLSPVFATASHRHAAPLTPVRAGLIAAASGVAVYALGGVTPVNAARLAPAFSGIAAIGALIV